MGQKLEFPKQLPFMTLREDYFEQLAIMKLMLATKLL